jgi:hypothetical protein
LILTLQDEFATQKDVSNAGLKLMIVLYGGKLTDELNTMRYTSYCRMAATSLSRPKPEKLPPTERATYYHSLRAHMQAVVWKTMNTKVLNPQEWGWKEEHNTLVPVLTDNNPAPQKLLNIIRCKCKSLSALCSSALCSCRINGLKCVTACTNCHGEDCSNAEPVCNDSDTSSASGDEYCVKDLGTSCRPIHEDEAKLQEEIVQVVDYKNEVVCDLFYESDFDWVNEEIVGESDIDLSKDRDP